jgi:pimeloyl-ACP methyl ester carboxylesterase
MRSVSLTPRLKRRLSPVTLLSSFPGLMPQIVSPDSLVFAPPVTVIAVHGNGGGAFRFSMVAERVPRDVRFIAPDLPGFGHASRPTPLPTIRAYAEWLADVVDAAPGPRVLLGHGIGGAFVLELLQRYDHLINGVILHAPVGARLSTRRFPILMKPRPMRWLAQRALSSPMLRPVWQRQFFRAPVPDYVSKTFFSNYRKCAAFGPMFDMITPRWFESLAPVQVPAVLLWGGRERVLSPSHAAAYQTVLPQAEIVIEPEWDHFPMLDAPASYATRISDLAHELV